MPLEAEFCRTFGCVFLLLVLFQGVKPLLSLPTLGEGAQFSASLLVVNGRYFCLVWFFETELFYVVQACMELGMYLVILLPQTPKG